jgi:multicomponent Na+:H+ antiporter subunit B
MSRHRLLEIAVLVIAGAVFLVHYPTPAPPKNIAEYVEQHGRQETGAPNLVSSIYLGYRILDTLGETIVLLVTVSGVALLLERRR